MKYLIHTYRHASGHMRRTRRNIYTAREAAQACKNFEVLGGRIEWVEGDLLLVEKVRQEHAEWSDKTFGDVGPSAPLKHLAEEAIEAAEAVDDLSEWADMQLLLWDAQRRAGITDDQLIAACVEKLAVNKARTWKKVEGGEHFHHEESEE